MGRGLGWVRQGVGVGNEPLPIVGYVRQVRRRMKLSQRELAQYLRMPQSTISRIEAGTRTPTIATFARILRLGGLSLAVVDEEGRFCPPLEELAQTRDWGGRRWPAHLGLILDPQPGEWWGDCYGLVRPPETVHRDPAARQRHRDVFHRLRGIATTGATRDWRDRHAQDAERLAAWDEQVVENLVRRALFERRQRRRGPGRGRLEHGQPGRARRVPPGPADAEPG